MYRLSVALMRQSVDASRRCARAVTATGAFVEPARSRPPMTCAAYKHSFRTRCQVRVTDRHRTILGPTLSHTSLLHSSFIARSRDSPLAGYRAPFRDIYQRDIFSYTLSSSYMCFSLPTYCI